MVVNYKDYICRVQAYRDIRTSLLVRRNSSETLMQVRKKENRETREKQSIFIFKGLFLTSSLMCKTKEFQENVRSFSHD